MDTIDAADDLAVLNPPVIKGIINGREIVCREYGFIEELKLRVYSQPFIDDLKELMITGEASLNAADALFGRHANAIEQLIAASADIDVEFIRSLNRKDGNALMDMWWRANGDFFVGCATDYASSQLRAQLLRRKAAGQTSMQRLSQTDTTQSASAATPTDS